jgi:hypothetical protein
MVSYSLFQIGSESVIKKKVSLALKDIYTVWKNHALKICPVNA